MALWVGQVWTGEGRPLRPTPAHVQQRDEANEAAARKETAEEPAGDSVLMRSVQGGEGRLLPVSPRLTLRSHWFCSKVKLPGEVVFVSSLKGKTAGRSPDRASSLEISFAAKSSGAETEDQLWAKPSLFRRRD